MAEAGRKARLAKDERREQLLETALAIVRERGADALTLGSLAERAGVSRPIAYEHFATRSGLLVALYERLDERQARALVEALARTPARLEDVGEVMSRAYFGCYASTGPEWHAISAALQGSGEMESVQQRLVDAYVAIMARALDPFTTMPVEDLRVLCVALLGAADAIARELGRGRIDQATAIVRFASLIANGLGEPQARGRGGAS